MFGGESRELTCPYCMEAISIFVDMSIPQQNYIEDCEVCCRPISLHVTADLETGHIELIAERST